MAVQVVQQLPRERDVLWPLRAERVEPRLVLAGRVEPPLDTDPRDRVSDPEAAADDADGADDAQLVRDDLVPGAGEPVAARCANLGNHGPHFRTLLFGVAADAGCDQFGLNRRAAGAIDVEQDGPALSRSAKRPVDQRVDRVDVKRAAFGEHAV